MNRLKTEYYAAKNRLHFYRNELKDAAYVATLGLVVGLGVGVIVLGLCALFVGAVTSLGVQP